MNIKPIRSKAAYTEAMRRIDALWGAPAGSAEGDELEILAILVERYEAEYELMPVENIAFLQAAASIVIVPVMLIQ